MSVCVCAWAWHEVSNTLECACVWGGQRDPRGRIVVLGEQRGGASGGRYMLVHRARGGDFTAACGHECATPFSNTYAEVR
jgi:hypothetical protein